MEKKVKGQIIQHFEKKFGEIGDGGKMPSPVY
jgi:hypothetical protein